MLVWDNGGAGLIMGRVWPQMPIDEWQLSPDSGKVEVLRTVPKMKMADKKTKSTKAKDFVTEDGRPKEANDHSDGNMHATTSATSGAKEATGCGAKHSGNVGGSDPNVGFGDPLRASVLEKSASPRAV